VPLRYAAPEFDKFAARGVTFIMDRRRRLTVALVKVKVKFTLEQATKGQMGSRDITLLFL
jgi:hypothetical protein